MEQLAPHELGVVLLSFSFLAALVAGGIAGWLGGMMIGAGTGALAVSAFALSAAWITWQGGDQPDRGMVRVEGTVIAPAESSDWRPAGEAYTNHDLLIRYVDQDGRRHEISGAYARAALTPGQNVNIDYPPGTPDRPTVADPDRHRTLLIVFLLFGVIPFAMSLVMFASAWEDRAGARADPAPRSPGVQRACSRARVAANLALLAGFVVTFWYSDVRSFAYGFPVIGAAALAHAAIAVAAGMRLSGALTFLVIGVGFIGFALLAHSGGPG